MQRDTITRLSVSTLILTFVTWISWNCPSLIFVLVRNLSETQPLVTTITFCVSVVFFFDHTSTPIFCSVLVLTHLSWFPSNKCSCIWTFWNKCNLGYVTKLDGKWNLCHSRATRTIACVVVSPLLTCTVQNFCIVYRLSSWVKSDFYVHCQVWAEIFCLS